jgi:hypothetical protein
MSKTKYIDVVTGGGDCPALLGPESDYVRAARAVGITFGDRP